MSNQIELVRTKFTDTRTGNESYGYRIFDDYAAFYSIYAEGKAPEDDLELLRSVAKDQAFGDDEILDATRRTGLTVDGCYYTADQMVKMLQEISNE